MFSGNFRAFWLTFPNGGFYQSAEPWCFGLLGAVFITKKN